MSAKRISASLLGLVMLTLVSLPSHSQGFLRRQGKNVVNDNGVVKLRGVGLGSWLVEEGYIMGIKADQVASPRQVYSNIKDLVGSDAQAKALIEEYRDNLVKREDIRFLKSLGYNHVRVPFHYGQFYDTLTNQASNEGFRRLDSLVSWCAESQIYMIPDLHCAPGSQNEGWHSDHVPGSPRNFWYNDNNFKIAAGVWRRIAAHYKDNIWVGGYDLLNEPQTDNGLNAKVLQFYKQSRDSIRTVDNNHMLIAEGTLYAYDLTVLQDPTVVPGGRWDDNLCLSSHSYWTNVPNNNITDLTRLSNEMDVPIWLGEFGENSNHWIGSEAKDFESRGWGWCNWSYKKVQSINPVINVKVVPSYKAMLDYWLAPATAPRPTQAAAIQAMHDLSNEVRYYNGIAYQKDMMDALMRADYLTASVPYTRLTAPGTFMAVDYDMGANGIAAYSPNYQVTSTANWVNWNTGWTYRNDAVGIEEGTPGVFNVGWTANNNWMKYTFECLNADDNMELKISTASAGAGGRCRIEIDGTTALAGVALPGTGGWATWQDVTAGRIRLTAGMHTMRFFIEAAGFNVKSFTFTSVDGTEKSISAQSLKLFPNPASSVLQVESQNGNVSVFDVQGRKVAEATSASMMKTVDVSSLPAGVYAVRSGEQTQRFVKE
ncbi:MAG: carbohydrate-binding protein [Bacteroidota bacterium]